MSVFLHVESPKDQCITAENWLNFPSQCYYPTAPLDLTRQEEETLP